MASQESAIEKVSSTVESSKLIIEALKLNQLTANDIISKQAASILEKDAQIVALQRRVTELQAVLNHNAPTFIIPMDIIPPAPAPALTPLAPAPALAMDKLLVSKYIQKARLEVKQAQQRYDNAVTLYTQRDQTALEDIEQLQAIQRIAFKTERIAHIQQAQSDFESNKLQTRAIIHVNLKALEKARDALAWAEKIQSDTI